MGSNFLRENFSHHIIITLNVMTSTEKFLVFVYGTLKKGQPNHHWLSTAENGWQRFLGEAETNNKFPLVIASRYNIPYLIDQPGTGNRIHGEDHPNYYQRRPEKV